MTWASLVESKSRSISVSTTLCLNILSNARASCRLVPDVIMILELIEHDPIYCQILYEPAVIVECPQETLNAFLERRNWEIADGATLAEVAEILCAVT